MRTAQQKQIIAHKNKLNRIVNSKQSGIYKACACLDILLALKLNCSNIESDTALAKVILTSRAIDKIN